MSGVLGAQSGYAELLKKDGVVRGWNPLEEARWHTAFATYATEFRQATRPHCRIAHQRHPLLSLTSFPASMPGALHATQWSDPGNWKLALTTTQAFYSGSFVLPFTRSVETWAM